MIICMRAKRKEDGTIDPAGTGDISAFRESDVSEIVREGDGKVLVRRDSEPADYWDCVIVDATPILSAKLRDALSMMMETKKPEPEAEPPKRKRGRPRKNA